MSNAVLLVPLLAASGLLVVSGSAKLREPGPAAASLRAAGLPVLPVVVRLAAAVELAAGAACLLRPAAAAPAVGALYLVFAVVVAFELRHGGSCGCLGSVEIPPSPLQLGLNLVLAGVAWAAAAAAPPGVPAVLHAHPFSGLVVLVAAATATYLCVAVMTYAPAALSAYRRPIA